MLHSESNHTPSQLKANFRQDKKVLVCSFRLHSSRLGLFYFSAFLVTTRFAQFEGIKQVWITVWAFCKIQFLQCLFKMLNLDHSLGVFANLLLLTHRGIKDREFPFLWKPSTFFDWLKCASLLFIMTTWRSRPRKIYVISPTFCRSVLFFWKDSSCSDWTFERSWAI